MLFLKLSAKMKIRCLDSNVICCNNKSGIWANGELAFTQ